jgi:hypothetical protein
MPAFRYATRFGAGAIVALGLTAAASQPASAASARNFFSPGYLGQPLAFCLDGQTSCGKPAATAWCQTNGYDEALSFARRTISDGEQPRFADTGNLCTGSGCIGFRQIRCFKATQ